MKSVLLTLSLLVASVTGFSQTSLDLQAGGCGTITSQAQIEKIYDFVQHNPAAYAVNKGTSAVDTLPLSIHIVGNDAGAGYYKLNNLFSLICDLNNRYAPANMYFAIQWPITYIDNSDYYIHDFSGGAAMMGSNNIANTVNLYFVGDPAGNCGYFMPSGDALAISISCAGLNSTTATHELGHYFSLPHPFHGWEDGATPSTPELVTRGTGANCSSRGDGFCDTEADFLSGFRWSCPYTGSEVDQHGDPYHPDSSLYMSYSLDVCQDRFSNMQIAAMQWNVHHDRSDLLGNTYTAWSGLDSVHVIAPAQLDSVHINYKSIIWHAVPGADRYWVQVMPTYLLASIKQDVITSDTSLLIDFDMVAGGAYSFKITPLSSVNVCRPYILKQDFFYSETPVPLSVASVGNGAASVSVYPNPAENGNAQVRLNNLPQGSYEVNLMTISGQLIGHSTVQYLGGDQSYGLPAQRLTSGLYFVRVTGQNNQWTQKFLVQ